MLRSRSRSEPVLFGRSRCKGPAPTPPNLLTYLLSPTYRYQEFKLDFKICFPFLICPFHLAVFLHNGLKCVEEDATNGGGLHTLDPALHQEANLGAPHRIDPLAYRDQLNTA